MKTICCKELRANLVLKLAVFHLIGCMMFGEYFYRSLKNYGFFVFCLNLVLLGECDLCVEAVIEQLWSDSN